MQFEYIEVYHDINVKAVLVGCIRNVRGRVIVS